MHRTVLCSFTLDQDISQNLLTVNHKNPNKENNSLLNLEQITGKANIIDSKIRNGYSIKLTLSEDYEGYVKGQRFYIFRGVELTSFGIGKHALRNAINTLTPRYGVL